MHALVFAGGSIQPGRCVDEAIATARLIIAADGGARSALLYGCTPDIVIGDFDSIDRETLQTLQTLHTRMVQVAREKDETDTELAIETAIEHGATAISLLGATGGERFDHSLANVFLLADFTALPIRMLDGLSSCQVLVGPDRLSLSGQSGDLLSIFPLTQDARGVTTEHLYYPLLNATLKFGKPRGISNVFTGSEAGITLNEGMVLVIHTGQP